MPLLGTRGAASAKGFGFTAATAAAAALSKATTIFSGTSSVFPAGMIGHTDGNFYVGVSFNGVQNIMKFDGTTGAIIWQRQLTRGQSDCSIPVNCVALDSSNNVYFTFRDGTGSQRRTHLIKYNSAGVIQWQRQLFTSLPFGDGSNTEPGSVSCNAAGTLITVTMTYLATYSPNVYSGGIITYNGSGTLQWQRKITAATNTAYLELNASVYDSSDNIYVSGWTQNNNLGVILKYNSSGTIQWRRDSGGGKALGLGLDSSNNVYISAGDTPNNGTNFNLTKCDSSGTYITTRDGGNGGIPTMPNMAVDSDGNTYGMRNENDAPYEAKASSTNSSIVTRFSNRIFRTAGVQMPYRSYGSSLLGSKSAGLYWLAFANYSQTAGGFGGVVYRFLRSGTDVSLTEQTVAPLTWYVTATASTARATTVTFVTSTTSELIGNVTDAAGGQTDSAGTLSSNSNFN
jgi:hypothetical protein